MSRLSSHFRNKADEARVARVWSKLDERFTRHEARRPWRLWAGGLTVCSALALMLYFAAEQGEARQRAAMRAMPAAQVLQLADGSRVEHAAQDRVEIDAVTAERVELSMTRGHAMFRVAENRKRAFLTHAGGYTIRVVGTQYAVDLEANGVRVEVSKGEVEVRRDGSAEVWRVRAGQTWSSSSVGKAPLPRALPTSESTAAEETPEPAPDSGSHRVTRPKPSAQANANMAATLFQRAQDARAAGQRDETQRLLSEFLRRFPADPRAGLAAFELGRLRLEAGDPLGAREALDRAESAGDAFREQVQGRRVQALEESGDLAACRAARNRFLEQFPHGSFAEIVRHRCP